MPTYSAAAHATTATGAARSPAAAASLESGPSGAGRDERADAPASATMASTAATRSPDGVGVRPAEAAHWAPMVRSTASAIGGTPAAMGTTAATPAATVANVRNAGDSGKNASSAAASAGMAPSRVGVAGEAATRTAGGVRNTVTHRGGHTALIAAAPRANLCANVAAKRGGGCGGGASTASSGTNKPLSRGSSHIPESRSRARPSESRPPPGFAAAAAAAAEAAAAEVSGRVTNTTATRPVSAAATTATWGVEAAPSQSGREEA